MSPSLLRIRILTTGSRGDVQPYLALGRGLAAAGHDVVLLTAAPFEGLVAAAGLAFRPLNGDFLALAAAKGGMDRGGGMKLLKQVKPMLRAMLDDAWRGCRDADLILHHPKTLGGPDLGEKLGVPAALALLQPIAVPTAAFPVPLLPPGWRLPGWLARASYALTPLAAGVFGGVVGAWRTDTLGLPARRPRFAGGLRDATGRPATVLHGFSPLVVPPPPDWPPTAHVTGWWQEASPAWAPPAELQRFLEAGPAPVYVGFGSMTTGDPRAKAALVVEAVRLAGVRAVIARGWGGLAADQAGDDVFWLDEAPHDRLFPLLAALVHHGGAGTTGAGLRAGRPTLVCPFFGDQPFWGERVHALGLGPRPIPQKALTAGRLAAALREATTDAAMRARAEALGAGLRAEDGVARAVEIVAGLAAS